MRIDGSGRIVVGLAPRSGAAAGGFRPADAADPSSARPTASVRPAPGLESLIALQAIQPETPRDRRRKALKRGRGLLDALDDMKLALIEGRGDGAALTSLAAQLRDARAASGEAGLDDALSAIELRAEVELAKRRA